MAASVQSARLWRAPDHTRLVFDLSTAVEHHLFTLDNPARVVIDLDGVTVKTSFDKLNLDKTPIAKIRTARRGEFGLRVVLDLTAEVSPKSFSLKANEQYSDRLVIDLFDKQRAVSRSVEELVKKTNRKIVIAIDAGHGGEDPGALGPKNVREKVVALQIAQRIDRLFDKNPHFQGELVRKGDYYIAHRKRTQIARNKKADFFVSVHADAFTDSRAYGASVYALSTKGASSETARYLATKENRADLIGGARALSLDNKDAVLAGVLADLSMTATLASSLQAGNYVLENMKGMARLHKKQVEQAGFLVLKSLDIPSLLVETGFISNPKEAKKLSSAGYQQKMADAIYRGLVQYYMDHPPLGTALAEKGARVALNYVIVKGDTLSEIATRHKTSVGKILSYNRMTSSTIRVGQTILIPSS